METAAACDALLALGHRHRQETLSILHNLLDCVTLLRCHSSACPGRPSDNQFSKASSAAF